MSLQTGVTQLKNALTQISSSPGIYRMLDENETILYIGKAKNLHKRVTNYTQPERLSYRIKQMVSKVTSIRTTETTTEAEALLLEANLIKKHQPRYNILLKDDKSFPYIVLTKEHDYPRIMKHRGAKRIAGDYYGPFTSANAVNTAIADLQKAFLLRPCADVFFKQRTRPCMEYQIKRCSAPCVDKITTADYAELVTQTKVFLSGKTRDVQTALHGKMISASDAMEYEKAAGLRNRIQALNQVQARQSIHEDSVKDADIIGIHHESGQCCIQVFFYRHGQCYGNQGYFPHIDKDDSTEAILAAFIMQYYQTHLPPAQIILSHPLEETSTLEEALSSLVEYTVHLNHVQKGKKRKLVESALHNANIALRQRILQKDKQEKIFSELETLFSLPRQMQRVEVYDNSHIMGKYDTGAMIVAGRDGFIKKSYRRFNIKDEAKGTGDDYAMMHQVIYRRFKRLLQDAPDYQPHIWPDLVLIDGGVGQMSVVKKALTELGLQDKIPFVCISKGVDRNAGKEQFHMPEKGSFTIAFDSAAMYYLQRLRDEAHNYAIGTHRNKRSKSVHKSALDEISGIGGQRKKDLLRHFGSAKEVLNAPMEELSKVSGISQSLAKTIYDYGHGE